MGTSVQVAEARTIKPASANGSVSEITSASGTDSSDWFGSVARPLLGKEPGVALHYIVGDDFPISTCEKYVAKTEASRRQPPAWFLLVLFRARQGEPFARALLSDCEWFKELVRLANIGTQVLTITKQS